MDQTAWLVTAVVLGTEYGLKQWFEVHPRYRSRVPVKAYTGLRIAQGLLLWGALGAILPLPARHALFAVIATAVAACEIPLAAIQRRVRRWTGLRCRLLQLVPMLGLVALSLSYGAHLGEPRLWFAQRLSALASMTGAEPTALAAVACVFLAISQPANYVIRALIDKETDRMLAELVVASLERPVGRNSHSIDIRGAESRAVEIRGVASRGVEIRGVKSQGVEIRDVTPPSPAPAPIAAAGEAIAACAAGAADDDTARLTASATRQKDSGFQGDDLAPPERHDDQATLRAGRTIGILERWLIVTLILISQYALLGLVLTAKSIARYKQLEHADFAEYYLLGTLYSTLIALFAGLGLRSIL